MVSGNAVIRKLENDFSEDDKITLGLMKEKFGEYVTRECLYRLVTQGGPTGTRYSSKTKGRAQAVLSSLDNPGNTRTCLPTLGTYSDTEWSVSMVRQGLHAEL